MGLTRHEFGELLRSHAVALAPTIANTDIDSNSWTNYLKMLVWNTGFWPRETAETYFLALGRLPESALLRRRYESRDEALGHLADALTCSEFALGLAANLRALVPGLPMSWFVHVPKTGGTSIESRLRTGAKSVEVWNSSWSNLSREWPGERSQRQASRVVLGALLGNGVVVTGHVSLAERLASRLIAPTDNVFCALREPRDRLISEINYISTVMTHHGDDIEYATWRRYLSGLSSQWASKLDDAEFMVRLCEIPEFRSSMSNIACRYVGGDTSGANAIELSKLLRVSFLDFEGQADCLAAMGMNPSEVTGAIDDRNDSYHVVHSWANLSPALKKQIKRVNLRQDLLLWDWVCRSGRLNLVI